MWIGNKFVLALVIICVCVRRCRLRLDMFFYFCIKAACTWIILRSWLFDFLSIDFNSRKRQSGDGQTRRADVSSQVNTFMGHSILPSSSLTKCLIVELKTTFCILSAIVVRWPSNNLHSDGKTHVTLKSSRHKRSKVTFAQGQQAVLKWCLMRVWDDSSFINKALKWDPWSVMSHSIAPKHDIHFDIVLTAASLSTLMKGYSHVYAIVLSVTTKIYFRLLSPVDHIYRKSAWTISLRRLSGKAVNEGRENRSPFCEPIQRMYSWASSRKFFINYVHQYWSEISLRADAYTRCPFSPQCASFLILSFSLLEFLAIHILLLWYVIPSLYCKFVLLLNKSSASA